MSYEFRVGDTVRQETNQVTYVIAEITNRGWCRSRVGAESASWQPAQLKLIGPAGYRPVRADEMDQCPQADDVFLGSINGSLIPCCAEHTTTFREHLALVPQEPFFRPLEKPEPAKRPVSHGMSMEELASIDQETGLPFPDRSKEASAYTTNPNRASTALSVLQQRIEELEQAEHRLGMVRATLVLNFCTDRQHGGIRIAEKPSALDMLIDVLEAYNKKIEAYDKQLKSLIPDRGDPGVGSGLVLPKRSE